jgi:pentatricopeptide repeat protein
MSLLVAQITYTTLIDGCVRARDLFLAEELLQDMRFTGVHPNTVTFNIMLRGYCQESHRPIQVWRCHPRLLSPWLRFSCKLFCSTVLQCLELEVDFRCWSSLSVSQPTARLLSLCADLHQQQWTYCVVYVLQACRVLCL